MHVVMTYLRPQRFIACSIIITIYFVYDAFVNVSKTPLCMERLLRYSGRNVETFRPFESDILLEYQANKPPCPRNRDSGTLDCAKDAGAAVQAIATTTTGRSKIRKAVLPQFKSLKLLTCDEIAKFLLHSDLSTFKPVASQDASIQIRRGVSTTFFHPRTYQIELKKATVNTTGYRQLSEEYEKRSRLDWNAPYLPRLLGACVKEEQAIIIEEFAQGSALCDSALDDHANFSDSNCFNLTKLRNLLDSHEDKAKSLLQLLRNFICLVGFLEKRNFLVEDFHGSNFLLGKDMSIMLKTIANLIYHGGRNVYGNSICIKDAHCPRPSGTNWYNGSANQIIYHKCTEVTGECLRGRCLGFNSSVHLCGISNWILKFAIPFMAGAKERARLLHVMDMLSNPYSEVRKTGTESCAAITDMLSAHVSDNVKQQDTKKVKFHLGHPPQNMLKKNRG